MDLDHADHEQTPKSCEEALAEVYTYLDGELTDAKRQFIAAHLDSCSPCYEAFDFEAELRMVVSSRARSDQVPEELRIRISEKITHLRIVRSDEGAIGDPVGDEGVPEA